MWITFTKGPIFGKNKYKTAFFHMSDFLYKLSYLIHCKHFVDIFSLIIVIVTSRNIILFVLIEKKQNFKCEPRSHYVQILHNKSFNEVRDTVRSISDWVSEKFHFVTAWWFSTKNVANCDFSHNSSQHEKLNIFIVFYSTSHQNSWISKFMLHHLQS